MTPARFLRATGLLLAVLLGALVLCLACGSEPLQLVDAFRGIQPDAAILQTRVPRVVLAAIVGAALGVSGAVLQALVENPLADPFILGISGGAAVGATLIIALGLGSVAVGSLVAGTALCGALAAAAVVFTLGRVHGRLVPERMVLVGVVCNAFASALIMAIESLVSPNLLQDVISWLLGSLNYPSTTTLVTSGTVVALCVVLLTRAGPTLNLLSLGELDAHGLGVDVERSRAIIFLLTAVIIAIAVSLSGVVGFVGLIVPHMVRLSFGSDHRLLVPASAIGGAAFLMVADLGSRLFFRIAHTVPPVGMVTALIGAPLFLYLLLHRTRRSER